MFVSEVCASSVVLHLVRIFRSPDDIEERLSSDSAPLDSAGVLPLKQSRHGGGTKCRLCSTCPPSVCSGHKPPNLMGCSFTTGEGNGDARVLSCFPGFIYCAEDVARAAVDVLGQLTGCVSHVCRCVHVGDASWQAAEGTQRSAA